MSGQYPGREAIARKGWLGAHRWLILRRLSQTSFLGLFLLGPWAGIWWVKGSLASSMTLDFLPLTDPLVLLQGLVAGHWPEMTALVGAGLVIAAYLLVGGRTYCSWVCPVNPVTDAAHWLHVRLGLPKGWQPKASTRLWLLGTVVAVSAVTGTIAWELANPVTMLQRGLVFGMGAGWTLIGAVFLFDLLVARRGWCGRLCPVGAFYGLLGTRSLVRVSAARRADCDDCMDCFAVCPEMAVITPALRGKSADTPLILAGDCTNCGRCVDVCDRDVFRFTHRFDTRPAPGRDAATPSPAGRDRAA
ncbi:quinol dehydrogenase ferredoxin subunit NapH [Cereibacter sediminicola]|uniref:quinol dehydrogenase ferredoxin subunit NapH n=1 Tax=Cereibacter sediminicola TaxID=2584941 RepID=UPI0011A3B45B|nr:quinol dehydrogenase ferredoxin subunit NapH [Cereibacter sediminicola]